MRYEIKVEIENDLVRDLAKLGIDAIAEIENAIIKETDMTKTGFIHGGGTSNLKKGKLLGDGGTCGVIKDTLGAKGSRTMGGGASGGIKHTSPGSGTGGIETDPGFIDGGTTIIERTGVIAWHPPYYNLQASEGWGEI